LGQLLKDKEILSKNVELYQSLATSEFSKYLEGVPTFVTYYHKNSLASKSDQGLEAVIEVVGAESPIKFDRIENFTLYGIEELGVNNIVDDEFGIDSEVEGDAVILPDTIKPLPDDFFTIEYNTEKYMFKVTDVQFDKINGKKYYKISFMLSREEQRMIEEQIETEFVQVSDVFGTEVDSILTKESSLTLQYIDKLYDKMLEFYTTAFMSNSFNVLLYKYNSFNMYNEYIVRFAINTDVLVDRKKVMDTIYIQDILKDNSTFFELYERTIYYALETKNKELLISEDFTLVEINDQTTPFFFDYEDYYQCYYSNLTGLTNTIVPHNLQFIDNVINNELYVDDKEFFIENIIINYFNDNLTIDEDFLDTINNYNFIPKLSEFLLVPCLLYILKDYKSDLSE